MGSSYLTDLALNWPECDTQIKVSNKHADIYLVLATLFAKMENVLSRIPPFFGSNSWVTSGLRSKSERVILANDPHIGFSETSTWYEAHLKTPEW